MPLIRSKSPLQSTPAEHELVQELVREIGESADVNKPLRQPIVIENEIPQTDAFHVTVIWERWRLVTAGHRSGVIVRAYEQAAPDRADKITIALGATTEEAIDLGLLPFAVGTTVKNGDSVDPKYLRKLMRDEGAVESPSGMLLCYPSMDSAMAARERLARLSKPEYWAVIEHRPMRA
jgi:hypothetical protein